MYYLFHLLLVYCNLVISLSYQHQAHQPYSEECVGEYTVEWRHSHKQRHHPDNEVYVEEDIPQPLAVVEHAFDIASLRDLDLLLRRHRNINRLSALSYRHTASELDFQLIATAGSVYLELVILQHTGIESVEEYRVRQPRLVPVAYMSDGQHIYYINNEKKIKLLKESSYEVISTHKSTLRGSQNLVPHTG